MASIPSETNIPRVSSVSVTSDGGVRVGRAGAVTGLVCAGWHCIWAALVATGLAQPLIDFVFWMHFIKPVYVVEPFEPVRAVVLTIVTGAVGYAIGSAFAYLWNRIHQ